MSKPKSTVIVNGLTMRKPRKPYTITKSREVWTKEEHTRFVTALQMYDRDWKKIEAYIGSKTVLQIRSHAQKHFGKVTKYKTGEYIPPPRPKKRAVLPYPRSRSTTPGKISAAAAAAASAGSASGNGTASDSGAGSDNCNMRRLILSNAGVADGSGTDNMSPDTSSPNERTSPGLNGPSDCATQPSDSGRLAEEKDVIGSKEKVDIAGNQERFYGSNEVVSVAPAIVPVSRATINKSEANNADDKGASGHRDAFQPSMYRDEPDRREVTAPEKDEVRMLTGKRSASGRNLKRHSPKRQVLDGGDGSRMKGRPSLSNEESKYSNGESSMDMGLMGANNSLLVLSNCVDMMSRDDGHDSGCAADWPTAAAARRAHRAKVIRARKLLPPSAGDEVYSEQRHEGDPSNERGEPDSMGHQGDNGMEQVDHEADVGRENEDEGRRIGSPPVATEAERANERVCPDPQRSSAGSGTASDDAIAGFTSSDRPSVSDIGVGSSCGGSGSGGSLENSDSGDNDEDPKSSNDGSGDDGNRQSPITRYSSPVDPNSSVSRENSPNRNSGDGDGVRNGSAANIVTGNITCSRSGSQGDLPKEKSHESETAVEKASPDEKNVVTENENGSAEGKVDIKITHASRNAMTSPLKNILMAEESKGGDEGSGRRDPKAERTVSNSMDRSTDEHPETRIPLSKGIAHLMNAPEEAESKRGRGLVSISEKTERPIELRRETGQGIAHDDTRMDCEERHLDGENELRNRRNTRKNVETHAGGGRRRDERTPYVRLQSPSR